MSEVNLPTPNWVSAVGRIDPALFSHLLRSRIRDEQSYLAQEHRLPRRIRSLAAQTRQDLLILKRIPLVDLVRVSPPWLLDMRLAAMGVPDDICEKMNAGCPRDIRDPGLTALSAEEHDLVRIALYRAGKAGAPGATTAPAVPTDRVARRVASAPGPVRGLLVADLPGLPRRARNALRSGGVSDVCDLDNWTDQALKFLPQFGKKSLDDLLNCLDAAIELAPSDNAEPEPDPEPFP